MTVDKEKIQDDKKKAKETVGNLGQPATDKAEAPAESGKNP